MAFLIRGQFEFLVPEPGEVHPEDYYEYGNEPPVTANSHQQAMDLIREVIENGGGRVLRRDEMTPEQQHADAEALRARLAYLAG